MVELMMIEEFFQTLARLSMLIFVITSMAGLGLSLTVSEILTPLKDGRLVFRVLLANFVLVPFLGFLLTRIVSLDPSLSAGLILLACASGAPFLPKLVQFAKGEAGLGLGMMVLLMVTTIAYVPIVLPWLLPGVSVNALAIAKSLVTLMLIPLAIALFIRSRYPEEAEFLQGAMSQASNISLIALFVLILVLNFQRLIATLGTGAIITMLVFIVSSLAIGYFLAPYCAARSVMGLGTAQRNISAALVVAAENFSDDPNVLTMIVVGSLLMLGMLLPIAGELGKRQSKTEPSQTEEPVTSRR